MTETQSIPFRVNEAAVKAEEFRTGDVFQINEKHGRAGWMGAFVLATEIKAWGIQGFVHCINSHDQNSSAYIRLKWEEIDYIGHAKLVPDDVEKP